jgi:hypothetical protein
MRYVYLLQSEAVADQRYVSITSDLRIGRSAQHWKIAAHVQIPAMETCDLSRVLRRTKGRDLRTLSQVRLRPRVCQQKALVSVDESSGSMHTLNRL